MARFTFYNILTQASASLSSCFDPSIPFNLPSGQVLHFSSLSGVDVRGGPGKGGGKAEPPSNDDTVTWEYDIPILTNRFMLWDFFRVFGLTAVIFEVILLLTSLIFAGEAFFLPLHILALVFGIIGVLVVFTVLLIYQNHFQTKFTITPESVSAASGRKEKKVNRIVMILALLSGKPGAMGSSLIAYSREEESISWRDVYKVTVHRGQRVITINNSWRTVLRLYCQPEIFEEVLRKVETFAAEGAQWRARQGKPKRRTFNPSLLGWVCLIAVAVIASLLWETDETSTLAFAAGGFVLLSRLIEGFLRRAFALIASVVSLLVLANLARLAFQSHSSFPWMTVFGYEYDTPLLVASTIGGLVLLIMSGLRLFGRNVDF